MGVVKKIRYLFSDKVWALDLGKCSRFYAGLVRFVKLLRITIDTFMENRMGFQCVSLSYFVTLSVIPLFAFIFAVTGGLGISGAISDFLYNIIPPEHHDVVTILMEKASFMVGYAKMGGVGMVSAFFLLWTVIWMMFQVERVFNNVWGIRRIPRKLYTRFSMYVILLCLMPFILILFSMGIAYYGNLTRLIGIDLSDIKSNPGLYGMLVGYVAATAILSLMYKFIPAVKVRYRYALKSALVSGAVFCLFQYVYLETQVFVARLNTIYGVIAAVPLFLIWINFSWQIIIYGAVLNYSYQNVDTYHLDKQ